MNLVLPKTFLQNFKSSTLKGVKVTFINMPIREQAKPNNPPVGPALLAARLREYGAEPAIIDLNIYRVLDEEASRKGLAFGRCLTFQEARALIERSLAKAGSQHVIGLSGLITTLSWQTEIAKVIRELDPDALLVSGGGLATQFREDLFNWIPELDAVSHSEGDDIVLKIALDAQALRDHGFDKAYKSGRLTPFYRDFRAGRPRFFYHGGRTPDLDSLPFPAYDLLKEDVDGFPVLESYLSAPVWGGAAKNSSATSFQMKRSISTISSRGCPFACKFCFRGAQGERNYGVRSADNLAAEFLEYKDRLGVDFIGLMDDNFMVSPKRITELADLLEPLARSGELRWGAHGRLDEAADLRPDRKSGGYVKADVLRVDEMARAGCIYIGFGAESASAKVLEDMGKGGFMLTSGMEKLNGFEFPRAMTEGIRNTLGAGIHGNCTWIMGYPGETLDDLKTSIAFIKWQQELVTSGLMPGTSEYDTAFASINTSVFTATAYPGTEMFQHPKVIEDLERVFGLRFYPDTRQPVVDENFRKYVLELNDATKMITNNDGRPLNYSAIPDDQFVEVRALLDARKLDQVLDYE
ncbi:B12-binding domain-containing radical SAM protein [Roseibium litorale]|uniref:B12-binding domain-containing radical SAM protein n=1 Tax=Roseibium litorale TaxID=2803841 RepID=A0ABR9CRE4_9HYPH|nr:radical SAM protein [Roseibium litorale]MBD8892826.1 B12-binding domain-containing radical SAM protein [Roseibium litorale]